MIVSGGDAAMPPELRIPKRFSCSEMHPGLCFTRDKDVYQSVRTCAATLERLLDTPGVYFFVRAEAEDRGLLLRIVCWFAHKRARRPYAKQTHLLTECTASGAIQDEVVQFRRNSSMFVHPTVWSIARNLLLMAPCRVVLCFGEHVRSHEDPSVARVNWLAAETEMWPHPPPVVRKHKSAAESALMALDGPGQPPRRQRRTGGIEGFVGGGPGGGPAETSDSAVSSDEVEPVPAAPVAKPAPLPPPVAVFGRGRGGRRGRGARRGRAGADIDPYPRLLHPNGSIVLNDDPARGYFDFKAYCTNCGHGSCTLTRKCQKRSLVMLWCFLNCASQHTDLAAHKTDSHWRNLGNRQDARRTLLAMTDPIAIQFRDAERRHAGLGHDLTPADEPVNAPS